MCAGFTTSHTSCCDVDTSVGGLCLPTASVCDDRKDFVFWDAYHTSDAANQVIAAHLYADMIAAGDVQEQQGNATTAAAPPVVRSPPRPLPRAPAPRPTVRGGNTTSSAPAAHGNGTASVPRVVTPSSHAAPPPRH